MPKRLTSLRLTKVDRVDAGAQPDAYITLVKRRDTPRKIEVGKITDPASLDAFLYEVRNAAWAHFQSQEQWSWWVDAVYDGFVIACASDDYYSVPYTQSADGTFEFGEPTEVDVSVTFTAKRLWKAAGVDPKKKERTAMPNMLTVDGVDLDLDALPEDVAKALTTLNEKVTKAAAEPEPTPPADAVDLDSLPEPVRKAIEKRDADLADLRKRAEEDRERAMRLEKADRTRRFVAKAKALPSIAALAKTEVAEGDVDKDEDGSAALGDVLDTIDAAAGSEVAETVEQILNRAHVALSEARKVVAAKGVSLTDRDAVFGSDPVAEFDAKVETLRNAKPDLTLHQARAQVMKAHPRLAEAVVGTPAGV